MGKLGNKRRNKRNARMRQLAEQDPEKFSREWTKYLVAKSMEAANRAPRLGSKRGEPKTAFNVVPEAVARLGKIGPAALLLEKERTVRVMTGTVARLVAEEVDGHLYRVVRPCHRNTSKTEKGQ